MSAKGTAFYLCGLIALTGVAASGEDFGWWGDKPAACQAPGTETTLAGGGKVVTAATIGERQGEWLHKLNGPPPTTHDMYTAADKAAEATVVYWLSVKAAARGAEQSERVQKYNRRKYENKVRRLAQVTAACSPCPTATPNGQPLTVAHRPDLTPEQRGNAATIAATGAARGMPTQGQVIALAAALQESGLRNLTYGDRDSVGVFQQRAGWGPVSERMNPAVAARKFYDALERVPDWQSMTVAQAAQAVQRSAYPGAYARWEGQARQLAGGVQPVDSYTCAAAPTAGKPGAWGGYTNGRIPASALAHPQSAPRALFRPDAAAAFDRLNAAYKARFGVSITVTDSYRDYPSQVRTKAAKGRMAATPGTSNHGWGLAADIGLNEAQYQWMRANAPKYGWDNPPWARPGGSKVEKWHWEMGAVGTTA